MDNKNRKKKRILFIIAGIVLLAAYAAGAFFLLRAGGEKQPVTNVRNYNDDSSLILLTGKDYSLEEEQEEKYMEQQASQEQQVNPPKEKNTAESIVKQKQENANQPGNGGGDQPGNRGDGPGGEGDPGSGDKPDSGGDDPEPVVPDHTPIIDTNIGSEAYGSNVAFVVRGLDYNGRVIDSFYYTVKFDGVQLYSTGVDGSGYVTYRANGQAAGPHQVTITIVDPEGNKATGNYWLQVTEEANVPVNEWVTLEVEARVVGYGSFTATEQIYKDESAAHFVQRVLSAYGYAPGMNDDSYLYRISGFSGGDPVVPAPINTYVEENFGELYGVNVPGSLGERDFTPNSGWIYLYNGNYQGVGLYGVTLVDGDVIHIGFTLWGGAEYNGEWATYGSW